MESKKSRYINRNKLNEFKETLTPETEQLYNILSKNIFPKSLPKIEILVENINSLNEKLLKKKRFSFVVSKEIKSKIILDYLSVFPKSIQEEFHLKYTETLN